MTLREKLEAASAEYEALKADMSLTAYELAPARAKLAELLMMAHRAGKLLVIEDEADAVRRMRDGMRNTVLSLDAITSLEAATAALAALKGESA